MKIIATKESLLNGIQTVQKAISTKNTIPILSGISIKAAENKLFFRATDLEIGIECRVPVQVLEEGEVVLPSRHFSELVRKLPNTKIHITYLPEIIGVNIRYDDAEVDLKGWPGEEFPAIPEVNDKFSFDIDPMILKNMIRQTIFATAIDDSRPIFNGALFEIKDNNFNMVTTDTHRLALKSGKINLSLENNINIIIPGKTLSEVHRAIREDDDFIRIKGNENQISFENDETRIISRLIEGKFPNYQQVIPQDFKTFIKIKTKNFQETIERANLFTNEKDGTSIIKIIVNNDIMQVTSKSEIGKVDEKIPIYCEGENLEISFNAKYLIDALKVIDSEDLDISLSGSLSPGIIKPGNNSNYLYLILPLRTI
ncbi:MAG: DNA polymerase III subunit beta [Bacillota bacterium]